MPKIQQQQDKTKAPFKVIAYSQDDTTKLDEGVLGLINNQIIQTTGSIQLKANFPNNLNHLWPGQLVNVRLLLDTRHDGLTVPAAVVQQGPNGAYAWVIKPDGAVEIRPITVWQISAGQALIDSGLKANEQVVVDGQYKLQPGVHVNILTGKAAEEADKALEYDPKLYQANELKARMALEDDDYKKAAAEADKALAIEPTALQAIAVRAAMDLLQDKNSPWVAKINNRAKGLETATPPRRPIRAADACELNVAP